MGTHAPGSVPEDDRIRKALELQESEQLDFKRVGNVDSLLKTVCALANTKGGWIVIGIEDPHKAEGTRRLFGLEENPEAFGDFQRQLAQRISPPLTEPHSTSPTLTTICCTLRDGSIGTIALVLVRQSNAIHSVVNGGTYARFGCVNRQLSATEITELSLRRGVSSATDALADVPLELLQTDWWHKYAEKRQLTRPFEQQLKHLGLCKTSSDGRWLPTWAAVLLFAENPGGLLNRKSAIRIFHYRGHQIEYGPNTSLIHPPVTIDGPVLHQIRESIRIVNSAIENGFQVTTTGFEIAQKYPTRVIQEAITNAVLHRDYRLDRDIHVRIFANRIEIESPGVFPGSVTPENLREIGSRPRNRAIVDHLREFPQPPNLDAGEGVRMMFATLEADGLYPPVYRVTEEIGRESVQVDLLNQARQDEWELVEDYLKEHHLITNADVRRITNSNNNVRTSKMLRDWVQNGLLLVDNPEAGTRIRRYRLNTSGLDMEILMKKLSEALVGFLSSDAKLEGL